jgi:hypothetical protein
MDEQGNLGEIPEENLRVITSVVNSFFYAFKNQEWVQAKKYCVTGSLAEKIIDESKNNFENILDSNTEIKAELIINDISIGGANLIRVYSIIKHVITLRDEIIEEGSTDIFMLLKNINNQWKIYDLN